MNRRTFLKTVTGLTMGLAGAHLALPYKAKAGIVSPVTDFVARNYLDSRIKRNILELKAQNPGLKVGETHCHSTFSDGHFPVADIVNRAADLGLDYLVISEHVMPETYPLEATLDSIRERWRCLQEWNNANAQPIQLYPAFEVSTREGHLILVLDEDYLNPRLHGEIRTQFAGFDRRYERVDTVAKLAAPFGGISIIPHPEIERSYPFGIPVNFAKKNLTGLVDAIEDVSTGHGYAENFSQDLGMAAIGSSDDHFNVLVGTTVTGFDARQHKDFIAAVKAKATRAIKVEDSIDPLLAAARLVL